MTLKVKETKAGDLDIRREDGKSVGILNVNDRTFTKNIIGSRHLLRKPPAICIDVQIVNQIARLAEGIIVVDRESGITYTVPMRTFLQYSFYMNRGHGDQQGLAMKYWNIVPPEQKTMFEQVEYVGH